MSSCPEISTRPCWAPSAAPCSSTRSWSFAASIASTTPTRRPSPARLGDPIKHPNADAATGSQFLLELDAASGYAASRWHTDLTCLPAYPAASILRALELPERGGDTMWANTAAAYADMPAPLQRFADELRAIHSSAVSFDEIFDDATREHLGRLGQLGEADGPAQKLFETEHPVVRVHPETGEKSLLLGIFVKRLVGFDAQQSQRILSLFQDYVLRSENTLRWSWQPGDVAIWDNRATQHRAVADFGDQVRLLRRATIHGTVPVGVDGSQSRVIRAPEPESAH